MSKKTLDSLPFLDNFDIDLSKWTVLKGTWTIGQ